MILRDGTVIEVKSTWNSTCASQVRIDRAPSNACDIVPGDVISAISYDRIVGKISEGDSVRVDASALIKKLGTGGYAMVTAVLGDLPEDSLPDNDGHVMKARYTPSQYLTDSVDEQQSEYHEALAQGGTLDGTPVIVTDLHSALPAIIAGIRHISTELRITYVYTDSAALPAWFSQTVDKLKQENWVSHVITTGQAFGGDFEAASLPSALLAAKIICKADIIIVVQGPGNLGTGTPYGFSGVDQAWALIAAYQLGGYPVMALRVSAGDQRERHVGISHHSSTVLRDLLPIPVCTVLPIFAHALDDKISELRGRECSGMFNMRLSEQIAKATEGTDHKVKKQNTFGLDDVMRQCPVKLSTMGRDYQCDPIPFLAAGVAGVNAARYVIRSQR